MKLCNELLYEIVQWNHTMQSCNKFIQWNYAMKLYIMTIENYINWIILLENN